ncbi:hypothetical protein ELY21_13130 [Legionella sp. km535]|uniref:hypothetical protein n=1 Tax=Legionella sp. km535 TaxID=2498107 RepID=UPI000F8CF2BE|nr:hypothetical protein [Legionella sp. km535]RUR16430.1 hypothetical protein ELY21_13130 [Legionella sp. km535]
MLKLNTPEEHSSHPLIKNIPWSIFSSPDFFNCQISKEELFRLKKPLEESSQRLLLRERQYCSILCVLFGHWKETDQVLLDAIKNNMKVLDIIALHAIVISGRTSLLKCFIENMSLDNREKLRIDTYILNILSGRILSSDDVCVFEIFEELIPSLITKLMNSDTRLSLWRVATSQGCFEILKLFARHMEPETIKKTISMQEFKLYSLGLMNPNQLQITHYFESFFEQYSPEDMILAGDLDVLVRALFSGHQTVINYFLAYPRIFSKVDKIRQTDLQIKVDQFIQFQLDKWRYAEEIPASSNTDACFSLQEISLAMLFARRFIRQDTFTAHEYLRKLLHIQSLAEHMHRDWIPDEGDSCYRQPNGLLRLALSERKISLAKCLLCLPAVRELAKAENYYKAEIPSCFAIETFSNKCDEQRWNGINDLERSTDEDCIFRLYLMTKTMVLSKPGHFACPESATNDFFDHYAHCAREDEHYHGRVITYLFSSHYGVMKLFVLLNQGLCISYVGNNHQECRNQIHGVGYRFNRGMVSQEEHHNFECFSNHLDFLINTDSRVEVLDYFHAALIKHYINTYIFPGSKPSFIMAKKPKEVWFDMVANGNFLVLEYLYVLMRIGGVPLYSENFKRFTFSRFFDQSVTQARKECDYLLDIYTDKFDDICIQSCASKIATGMAKELLIEDFSLNLKKIKTYQIIHKYAQKSYGRWDREQLNALSMAKFIKLAGLLALRFEHYTFFDVLLQLSKDLGPVYRYYNTQYLNQGLMSIPGISISQGELSFRIDKLGEFQNTWTDIVTLFRSPEIMEPFWVFLEGKIEPKIKHVPDIPNELKHNNIHFFEISYPGQTTMDWYLSLSTEQRKLNQALHLTLLELERENGFNLERESTGDVVPRFHGFVDSEYANNLLLSGYLFKECSKYLPGILHGENGHRLQWAAISFFIQQGTIRLPEGKNVHDFLSYVIKNNLWTTLVDHYECNFGGPHFIASWLRNTSQYPSLQKAMVIGYCNRMNKFLQNLPNENNAWNYERLILLQSCFEEQFATQLPRIKMEEIRHPMKKFFADSNGILLWGVYDKAKRTDYGLRVSDDETQHHSPASSSRLFV